MQILLCKEENHYCCANGEVKVKQPSKLKEGKLKPLYNGSPALSNRFIDNIVRFNLMFSFTSFSTTNNLENAAEKIVML